ncbi:MAG: RNA polymerase sigma factor [Microthrixaceae bacterium]
MNAPPPPPVRTGDRPDAELVRLSRGGDRRALDELLRRHHDRIHLLCRRLCRDRGDAEDATQHALIAIVRGLDRYDGRAEFSTWSYRVTTNACLDELRRRARRPIAMEPVDVAAGTTIGAPVDPTLDPELSLDHGEERSRVQQALDQLDEVFRVPVVLRDLAELDYAEIAQLLELPPGTVRSRIARGRRRLAALLDPGNQGTAEDVGTEDRR